MDKIKVIVADDMNIIAENTKKIIEEIPDIEVIGIANNGKEEYELIIV